MTFIMKLNFFGPVTNQGIIRKTISSTYNDPNFTDKTQKITVTADPYESDPRSDPKFLEIFEDF